jgi:sugar diacid utilization regulator
MTLSAPEPALRRTAVRGLTTRLGVQGDWYVRVVKLDTYVARSATVSGHVSAAFGHAISGEGGRPYAWHIMSAAHERSATVLVTSRTAISDESIYTYAGELVDRVHAIASDRFRCVAGIGGSQVGLERARTSFRQAELAAAAGEKVLPGPVIDWTKLGELAILLQLPLGDSAEDRLPDEVQRLLAYDKDGRSVETVQAFLDHAGSAPDTADALHVHRTTLYYRLERISEATGLDLDDGRTRLVLHLGLRLRELLRQQPQ